MMTSVDLRVANSVVFGLIDLRVIKKPKLVDLFRKKPNSAASRQVVPKEVFDVDFMHIKKLTEASFDRLQGMHLVMVLSDSIDREYPEKAREIAGFKLIMSVLRRRSHMGLLHGGARELLRSHSALKTRLGLK